MTEREFERGCQIDIVDESSAHIHTHKCCNKLDVYNWLSDLPTCDNNFDIVEVRFKNTRKGYYRNVNNLSLREGEIVAVEASPGHDIGIVSLTGELVREQMLRHHVKMEAEMKKVYRKAKQNDIQKWKEAIALEIPTMLRTRELAGQLKLSMKIGDVEFQGDRTKAIFYYIADERVDFRILIKHMADEFRIRIEMKQIGARQEAGRIGGIGPCGRELCCTTWMSNFNSVSTNAARIQEISLNPQKLAGQCSKLKCCLNFELDVYLDARRDFVYDNRILYTTSGEARHIKNDVFKKLMYYETYVNNVPVIAALSLDRVKKLIDMNRQGIPVEKLVDEENNMTQQKNELDFTNNISNESISRFDGNQQRKNRKKPRRNKNKFRPGSNLLLMFLLLGSTLMMSCDRNKVFEKYTRIDNYVWNYKNIIRFEPEINDTTTRHNIYILVRNATQYPYANLWVFVSTTAPNGDKDIDTVQCILADKNGKWLGDGMGDLWDNKILWKKNVRFPQIGRYSFQFEQGMRVENLPGIMDLGLRIEKLEKTE